MRRPCSQRLGWASMEGLLLLAALAGHAAPTGTGDYLIDVWTSENGLPNSSVTAIGQTLDGYLWVGTYNGLARFDGVRFENFDPQNTPDLQRARVRRLYLDRAGTLWINTYDGSLTSYRDGQFRLEWKGDGSFDATTSMVSGGSNSRVFLLHTGALIRRRQENGPLTPALSPSDGEGEKKGSEGGAAQDPQSQWQVLHPPGESSGTLCVEDGAGVLWGRGRDQRLWRYAGGHFELVAANCGLRGNTITCLTAGLDGRVWAGTDKEVAVWDGSSFQSMTPTNGEAALNVSWVYLAPDADVWIIANERVRKARGRQWVFEAEPCRGAFAGFQDRLGIREDRNGAVWLYHYGKGLFHIRRDGLTRQLDQEENFPGERVDCFYEDREGNLWSGVDRGGLVRLRQKRFVTLIPGDPRGMSVTRAPAGEADTGSIYAMPETERGAAKAAVSAAEDSQGAIWIGTYGGGLHRWYDGQWEKFSVPSGARRSFVFSVCPDLENRLWVSAREEDLFVESQGQFQALSPAVHGVKALLAGRDGRVWIGNKSGLLAWNRGQLRQFRAEDGIRRTDVRALAEDRDGAIWAGAGDGILYRIVSNRVESFQPRDALAAQPIWSLHVDSEGTIWAGTFRGGLLRFKDGKFVRYTSRDGLPDDVICQILEDGGGRLWIGSQQGIFCVTKAVLEAHTSAKGAINCTAYGRYDGLPSLECSGGYQPAAWRTKDGRLLFSTLKGVVSVQPQDLAPNRLPPPVVIEEVLVDGKAENLKSEIQKPKAESLQVPAGKRQVEFRYTGLSFVSPDRVRFRYKLDGLDKDFIEAGTRRSAQYSFLRPGQYSFQVTACNNDGVWNPQAAALALKVLPHFYETWWFLALAGVAAAGSVAGTVRHFATRRLRRELEYVERQRAVERDRARIAKDIHDDLGAGLTQITLLSELARRESREGGTEAHLERISDSARQLTRAMDEIVWAVDPQHDTLNGLMDYVSAFTEDFLRVAGIRCRMDLPAVLPALPVTAELRYNLFLALKEALNNIIKHAHATEVWLRLRLEPGGFSLAVEDNGYGMSEIRNPKSEIRNGKFEATLGYRASSGHGLLNMERRLAAIGGRCTVQSAPGEGTRVEMTVRVDGAASPIVVTGSNGEGSGE